MHFVLWLEPILLLFASSKPLTLVAIRAAYTSALSIKDKPNKNKKAVKLINEQK